MAEKYLDAVIVHKIDTTENWENNNPVLATGEMGIDSSNWLFKIGNGVLEWNSIEETYSCDRRIKEDILSEISSSRDETIGSMIESYNMLVFLGEMRN